MTAVIQRRPGVPPAQFGAHLHPVLRRVYAARAVLSDDELDLSLNRLLPVGSLPRVDAAAQLLLRHRRAGRVLVIGDFDADGATSSALVVRSLRSLGFAHVDFLVPNRFRFGYGLTPEIVALAAAREPTLLVTVDNGVSSIEGVEAARRRRIPVLVTDHHLPGPALPRADEMVNPNLPGGGFGSPALAGVGVAFYVVAALARAVGGDFNPAQLLDLVALGTVADVVPLDRNNRVLVSQGLRRIRAGRCVPGISALLTAGSRRIDQAVAADLAFAAAPRLNAAGRLTDMSLGIACLLADDPAEAQRLAAQLSALNDERREIERRMQGEAAGIAANLRFDGDGAEALGLCLFDPGWHQGVVGLVAGRIKDRLHRPTIAFAPAGDGWLRGSARSIAGVHVRDALDSIAARQPGLIEKFGGHALAAGLTLRLDALERFRAAFAAEIAVRADPHSLNGVIQSDGCLAATELTLETARALREGGPWGQAFPEPLFDGEFGVAGAQMVGARHLKLRLRSDAGPLEAIAFGYRDDDPERAAPPAGASVRLVYRLEVNEYNGREMLQLNCQQVRPT